MCVSCSVLVHRWRYFFSGACEGAEGGRRAHELRDALAALGRALLQPDIELLRINLDTLATLNTKWKLYHKVRHAYDVHHTSLDCGK